MERGLPAYIKRIAADLRAGLGLSLFSRLDPWNAARVLEIPVLALTDFDDETFVRHFSGKARAEFSAVTGFAGTMRFIVLNDLHHPHRQASSLAHELGHALLQHPPAPVLADDGFRHWDGELEHQAAVFSGALLVPDEACRWILKENMGLIIASSHFGVSEAMINYRLNTSGARKIQSRKRAQLAGRSSKSKG